MGAILHVHNLCWFILYCGLSNFDVYFLFSSGYISWLGNFFNIFNIYLSFFNITNISIYPIFYMLFKFFNYSLMNLTQIFLPNSLLVGTITLHPPILYLSIIMLLTNLFRLNTNISIFYISLLSFIALILGSYWGYFNSSWGYWWVGDIVEWILFSVFVISVNLKHTKWSYMVFLQSIWFSIIVVILLIYIRLGFLTTRHSFFAKRGIGVYILLIFWTILISNINYYVFKFKHFNVKYNQIYIQIIRIFLIINPLFYIYIISTIFKLTKNTKYLHYTYIVVLCMWSVSVVQYQYSIIQIFKIYNFKISLHVNKLITSNIFIQTNILFKDLMLSYFWQTNYLLIYSNLNIGLLFINYILILILCGILLVEFEFR